jgi:anti-sigma factor RsiW
MINHEHCHEIIAELSEYVEGTLSPTLCEDLERHLSSCENCTIVVNTLRKTIELYHETEEAEPPLPENVRDRLFFRLNLDDYLNK